MEMTWPATGVIPDGVAGDTYQVTCVTGYQLKPTEGNVTCQQHGLVYAYDEIPSDVCIGGSNHSPPLSLDPGHLYL